MAGEILGRKRELEVIHGFLDRAVEGLAGLVLEGEAGIGKSTLWLTTVMAARDRGYRVLSAELAEAERLLAHVGLGDLFEDVLDDVLPALAAPRRRVLEFTLLRKEAPAGDTIDPRALGVAARDALHSLARDRRLLLAIDDVQWLDDASAGALAFALRRLRDENLVLVLTRREGTGLPVSAIEKGLDGARFERLSVGPLSMGATHQLLQTRFGRTLPRPTLVRLHETSGGNPFYALELARGLGAPGTEADPALPLRIPESLERLVALRLRELSPATREALSFAAAGGRLSLAALTAAGVAGDSLAPAFEARVIEQTEDLVRFTHPLLASVLYQGLTGDARAHAHRRLAEAVNDPLARARHLALASSESDSAVAAEVDAAITIAASRGASITAAELAEHALRLTPPGGDDHHRRAVTAARMNMLAGDRRRARSEAEQLLTTTAKGRWRAEVLVLLSDVAQSADIERAIALRREALAEADSDPALEASIQQWLGWEVRRTEGFAAAEQHARAALELAQQIGDHALLARVLATLGFLRFNRAEPDALELVEEAYNLAGAVGQPQVRLDLGFVLAYTLIWSGRLDRARRLLEGLHQELSERDELRSADALWYLSVLELAAGRFRLAADYADRQREIKRQYAVGDQEDPLALWVVARIAAHVGELDRARELAERSRDLTHAQPVLLAGGGRSGAGRCLEREARRCRRTLRRCRTSEIQRRRSRSE